MLRLVLLQFATFSLIQADFDLLEAVNLLPSKVDTFQPPGSIVTSTGRNGTDQTAICFELPPASPTLFDRSTRSAEYQTIRIAVQPNFQQFGVSTQVKFNKFRAGKQTLFSVQSQDGTEVYYRTNLVSKSTPRKDCSQCMHITPVVEWRSQSGVQEVTPLMAGLGIDGVPIDDLKWHFLYFEAEIVAASGDSTVFSVEFRLYQDCDQSEVFSATISQKRFQAAPNDAVVVIGMKADGSQASDWINGCLETTLFRTTAYTLQDEQGTHCSFLECTVCKEDKEVVAFLADSVVLTNQIEKAGVDLATCQSKPLPASGPVQCGSGCTVNGTVLKVGEELVVQKGSGGEVCRRCKCVANDEVTCYDTCPSCTSDGEDYYDGETFSSASRSSSCCKCEGNTVNCPSSC